MIVLKNIVLKIDTSHGFVLAVSQHRHHQSTGCGNSDTDIVIFHYQKIK